MGSAAQLYQLGWPDFEQSLKKTVGGLRSHGDLCDVTLAAEGKTFPAHKIVLSASSPLLLDLLKVAPCKHPVILLPGVTAADVEFLLDFIYFGEVNVQSDRLPSLFQAARFLHIQGLSQGEVSSQIATAKPEETILGDDSLGPQNKDKDSRTKRPKRKCTTNAEMTEAGQKWARWDTSSNDESSPQIIEAETDRQALEVDLNYQASSNKQGTEAAITLATLQNVVPRPPWSKTQSNTRSATALGDGGDSLVEIQVPAHILQDANCDNSEQANDETYAAIAAAADAAAVAAATLSDKKGSSEQPVACPVCNFIIKQSRNLRRHLEIKHFGGARKKKNKGKTKTAQNKEGGDDTDCSTDPNVIEHVQVEIKSPVISDNNLAILNLRTDQKEVHPHTYSQSALQQYAHVAPALLSHQIIAPNPANYSSQHIQLLKNPQGNPHPIIAATVSQPGAHFLNVYGTHTGDIRPSSHQ